MVFGGLGKLIVKIRESYRKEFVVGVDVELKVGNLSLLYWRNYIDENALGIFFTDNDLIMTENVRYDPEDIDEEPHTEYKYSTIVQKAIDRLECLGYTIGKAELEFNKNKYRCLD